MSSLKKNLFILLATTISTFASALQLTPSSYEFSTIGSLSSHIFEVVNDSDDIIAVQISTLTREWLESQKELNRPSSDFEIFPKQLIIKPKEKKGIRIKWVGEKKIKSERAFRLVVQQLPVNFSKQRDDSSVKVLHNVIGAIYVTPNKAKAKLSVSQIKKKNMIVDNESNKTSSFLVFNVTNSGTKHIQLRNAGLVIKGDNTLNLTSDHFSHLPTQNVLAGTTLEVSLPWPISLGEEDITITLN